MALQKNFKSSKLWRENALILREVKYFRWAAAIAFISSILAAVFEGFGIGFLLGFLQNLVNQAEPFQVGIDWFDVHILGIYESDLNRLYRVSALILLSAGLRAVFNYFSFLYIEITKARLVDRLYKQIFEQLQALSLSFFTQVRSGAILNTLTAEVSQLQMAITSLGFILTKGTVLIVYVAVALTISWQLCLMAVMLFSLAGVGLARLNQQVREASFPVSAARSHFTSRATELINGIRTIQVFSSQAFERQRYYQASDEVASSAIFAAKQIVLIKPLAEVIATAILIVMIIVGMTLFVANGTLEIAALLTFLFVLFRLVPALKELNGDFAQLSSYRGSIQNIQSLLLTHDKPYLSSGTQTFKGLKSTIELVAVDFFYQPDTPVLKNVTLTIEKGKTVALVGASGSGKSTLADLITRLYDPTHGRILIDGQDLRSFEIHSLRDRMAVVSQDTFIFNATIKENIAYGLPLAKTDDIIRAARLSNALDFILALPQGFETGLGDRGVRLSGGQRQRIAIARAILRDPEILILDEATSALDSVSERLIQASLKELAVDRTVITIAHRLSTITKADKVVVIEDGHIVEQGRYDELLKQQGKLWKYHQLQTAQ
jgi:ATP-binding cassette, subfamily B, bacterial MsbA